MATLINTHGIIFRYKNEKGKLLNIKCVRMNPGVQKDLEAACAELARWGYLSIDTLGIVCNRPQRRNSKTTSKHSTGLMPEYEKWQDGSNGSRAFDLIEIKHKDCRKSKSLLNPDDRDWLIAFWEKHHFKLYHTGRKYDPRWSPDHIHCEI